MPRDPYSSRSRNQSFSNPPRRVPLLVRLHLMLGEFGHFVFGWALFGVGLTIFWLFVGYYPLKDLVIFSGELVVTEGSSLTDVTPKAFTAESTNLIITGKGVTGQALIEARISGTSVVCEGLNVMALPRRTLTAGIYYIKDSSSAGTYPVGGPAADTLIKMLNNVFKQAQIEFTLAESAVVDKAYDSSEHGIDGDGGADSDCGAGTCLSA